jgi:hypothetical protein
MERTVPKSASDEIDLYLRTLYSLLRSTTEVQIRTLEEVHAGMNSSLHVDARKSTPDISAFIYSILRLPPCISSVKSIVLGQSPSVFAHQGYTDVETWTQVYARARRRPTFFDGKSTLAVFIASRSDIEDVVPVLTAYQIEWNKLHALLSKVTEDVIAKIGSADELEQVKTADQLGILPEDLSRLKIIWGSETAELFARIKKQKCSFGIRLLDGSLSEYWRATRLWWDHIEKQKPELLERPVYFVSSNTHSITNLITGYAFTKKDAISGYVESGDSPDLKEEWKALQESATASSLENFLYYALKKFQQSPKGKTSIAEQAKFEGTHGVLRVPAIHSFDVEADIIQLNQLDTAQFDPRLLPAGENGDFLKNSDAFILNIDYPLGLCAYNILIKLAEHIGDILGVFIMGKAATLNGRRGDVMIPNVVQDEQSQNTYLFQNALTAADVTPYLVFGTVLDNQKAMSVLGTFLQNAQMMNVFYREGYTDIEMEAGPYLSAVYEMTRPKRHPYNEIVNLQGTPFDIGVLHYASDTPLSKGKNLGAGALSYEGMDSTYATSLAILRRIISQEQKRLKSL